MSKQSRKWRRKIARRYRATEIQRLAREQRKRKYNSENGNER